VNRTIRHTIAALFVSAGAVLAACSSDTEVGSETVTGFESESGEGALGGLTTTVPPSTTALLATTSPPTTAAAKATTTAPPQTTAPPTTVAVSITVKIQGDGQGNAFEPSNTRVFQNSTVRFHNVDSAAHQVRARNGAFQSPSIPPGGTWDFKATIAPGNYEFTDIARPYAVGYLEVLAR